MNLATTYLGLSLPHPVMPGASPLVDDLDAVRRLEDAGAAAIVMHSLFEEQITREQLATLDIADSTAGSHAEASSYFPPMEAYALGPEAYLEQIRRIKAVVAVPVIGSLNGVTPTGWLRYAKLIEEAGADAIEINVYMMANDGAESAAFIEDQLVAIARIVKDSLTIPVAVKLSPFYTSLLHVVRRLEGLGIDGLVLFNRFYQPDIDPEALEVVPQLTLSTPSELRLRLRWLAALSGRVKPALAVSGGVHRVEDVVRAIMAGADAVQVVSAVLENGPGRLTELRDGLARWLEEHGYESLDQMRGSMNLLRCPNPAAYERANYQRVLQSWRPGRGW